MPTPVVGARGLSSCGGRTLEHGDSCSRGTRASVVVEGGP